MVNALRNAKQIRSKSVFEAMLATDRGNYVDSVKARRHGRAPETETNIKELAYCDEPQPIGSGATISAPHMHAMQLELLAEHCSKGAKVLDVGSGSGYISACLARMVGPTGKVIAIEHVEELDVLGRENVRRDDPELLSTILFIWGDGRLGVPSEGPYMAIHVGAASPEQPTELIEQLAPGGRLVCPVGPAGGMQELLVVDKDKDTGKLHRKSESIVRFVPLTDVTEQIGPEKSSDNTVNYW